MQQIAARCQKHVSPVGVHAQLLRLFVTSYVVSPVGVLVLLFAAARSMDWPHDSDRIHRSCILLSQAILLLTVAGQCSSMYYILVFIWHSSVSHQMIAQRPPLPRNCPMCCPPVLPSIYNKHLRQQWPSFTQVLSISRGAVIKGSQSSALGKLLLLVAGFQLLRF